MGTWRKNGRYNCMRLEGQVASCATLLCYQIYVTSWARPPRKLQKCKKKMFHVFYSNEVNYKFYFLFFIVAFRRDDLSIQNIIQYFRELFLLVLNHIGICTHVKLLLAIVLNSSVNCTRLFMCLLVMGTKPNLIPIQVLKLPYSLKTSSMLIKN